jgi:hypothetical protein
VPSALGPAAVGCGLCCALCAVCCALSATGPRSHTAYNTICYMLYVFVLGLWRFCCSCRLWPCSAHGARRSAKPCAGLPTPTPPAPTHDTRRRAQSSAAARAACAVSGTPGG